MKIESISISPCNQLSPIRSSAEIDQSLGYPGELVENWQAIALAKMKELVEQNRALKIFINDCTKCGACADKCHYYLGTEDPYNMPVNRQELFRSVYRRYFTFFGRWFPWWVGAKDLDQNMLELWYRYFHQCSECRRCAVFCPLGIDTAEITMAAREILSSIGWGNKNNHRIILNVLKHGNNLALNKKALNMILQDLAEEVFEQCGIAIPFHLDKPDCDALLLTSSADFFVEPHIDGLIGYAKVLHQLNISWTISSYASEGANFALFTGSTQNMRKISQRIRNAAIELRVKRLIFGECGHAWRVASQFLNELIGPLDFLARQYRQPSHIVEITYQALLDKKLHFDKSKNHDIHATFHDSCNIARASRMGLDSEAVFIMPRAILKACCENFSEMDEATIKQQTFCCGGGGGLLADDLMPLRIKGSGARISAFEQVIKTNKVTHLVSICAICKSQFSAVFPHYQLQREQVLSLHQLVGRAIILEPLTHEG